MTTTTENAATPLASLADAVAAGALNDLSPAIRAEPYPEGADRLRNLPEFHADGSFPSPADRANLLAAMADGTLLLPHYEDFVVSWKKGGEARVALIQPFPSGDAIELFGVVYEGGNDGSWTFNVGGFNIVGDDVAVMDGCDDDVEVVLGWLVQHAVGVREDLARAREAGRITEQRNGRMVGYPGGAAMLRALPWTHVADEPATDAEVARVIRALKRGALYIPRKDFCITWGDSFGEAWCAEVLVNPRNYYGRELNIVVHHRVAVDDWRWTAGGDDYDAGGWIYGPLGGDYAVRVVLGHLARLARPKAA